MVPFWGKQLFVRVALLAGLSLVLLVVVWTISQNSGQAGNGMVQLPRPQGEANVEPELAKPPKEPKPSPPAPVVLPDKSAVADVGPQPPTKPVDPPAEVVAEKVAPADVRPEEPKPNQPAAEVKPDNPAKPAEVEKPKPEPKGKEVRGLVRAFDVQKRTLTLRVGEKRETAYRLAKDARLTGGANNMTLRDIKPGTRVRAVLGEGDTIVELGLDRGRERMREEDRKKPGDRAKDD
jgi:outer membrane biosynthesis protein TonB